MIIMLRMPETNGVVGRGRKRSRQHCQLSLLCCWSPRHMWLSRVGTGYAVASGPVLGRALAQRPGEEQTEGHPSSVCGGNELLGLVGAVTGHCFHSRENSIPVPPATGPSNFPRLTSLIIIAFGYQVTCVPITQATPFALTPTHTSRHLLTHPEQFRGPHQHWHGLFLSRQQYSG